MDGGSNRARTRDLRVIGHRPRGYTFPLFPMVSFIFATHPRVAWDGWREQSSSNPRPSADRPSAARLHFSAISNGFLHLRHPSLRCLGWMAGAIELEPATFG